MQVTLSGVFVAVARRAGSTFPPAVLIFAYVAQLHRAHIALLKKVLAAGRGD